MKRNLNFLAFVFLFVSCQKSMVEKQGGSEISTSSTKGSGSNQYTYLTVEVDDAGLNKIKSDASEIKPAPRLYVNGLENVRAELQHSSGDFYMMTNTLTSKQARRYFTFPDNTDLEKQNDYRIRIKDDDDNLDGETNLQEMVAGTKDCKMVMRLWSFDSKGNKFFDIIFNPTIPEGSGSDYVTVEKIRNELGEEFWEVYPNGGMNAAVSKSSSQPVLTPMPFKFILRRK